jgi:hypothetical protein
LVILIEVFYVSSILHSFKKFFSNCTGCIVLNDAITGKGMEISGLSEGIIPEFVLLVMILRQIHLPLILILFF